MNAALVIAAKDLRQRFRDRSAIILGFVAPVMVAALMSFAFSSVEAFHADIALVDNDRGQIAVALRTALSGPELSDVLTVEPADSELQARKLVDEGEVGAGLASRCRRVCRTAQRRQAFRACRVGRGSAPESHRRPGRGGGRPEAA